MMPPCKKVLVVNLHNCPFFTNGPKSAPQVNRSVAAKFMKPRPLNIIVKKSAMFMKTKMGVI